MASDPNNAESQLLKINLTNYVRLRTILDSLQLGAIERFMNLGPEEIDGSAGYEELKSKLMEVTQWLWKKTKQDNGDPIECPPGYIDCHGVCVPYPCPD